MVGKCYRVFSSEMIPVEGLGLRFWSWGWGWFSRELGWIRVWMFGCGMWDVGWGAGSVSMEGTWGKGRGVGG